MKQLVDRITREVLQQLSQGPSAPSASGAPCAILCAEGTADLEKLVVQAQNLGYGRITLILPKWARQFQSPSVESRLIDFVNPKEAASHLSGMETLLVSRLDGPLARKVTAMKADNLPSALILQALARNKRVEVLAGDGIPKLGIGLARQVVTAPTPGPVASVAASSPASQCHVCPNSHLCHSSCGDKVSNVKSAGAMRIGSTLGDLVPQAVAPYIDHTLLKPDATESEIRKLCEEARTHKFASVCVNPGWVSLAHELLRGSGVMVCTVIGFPLGATTAAAKACETEDAIRKGAEEIDMVINVGALKSGQYELVAEDIRAVVRAAQGTTVKVILETSLLNDEEKVIACELSKAAGAHFVKTSTGFGSGGATVHDIQLMRQTVGADMGVKASGGVRDYPTAKAMIEAGANRIGASASIAIVQGKTSSEKGKY